MMFDMGHLFDGVDPNESGFLFDDHPEVLRTPPDSLLYRHRIIVQTRRAESGPHGDTSVPVDVFYCLCDYVPRTQKTSSFSEQWAQKIDPQSQGGLLDKDLIRVLAPEWHGDTYTRFWIDNTCYEVDGNPVWMPDGSDMSRHWEVPAKKCATTPPPVVPDSNPVWGLRGGSNGFR